MNKVGTSSRKKVLCKVQDTERIDKAYYTIYKDGTWKHSGWSAEESLGEWDIVYGIKAKVWHFFYRVDINAPVDESNWTCDGDDCSRAIATAIMEAQASEEVEKMLKGKS